MQTNPLTVTHPLKRAFCNGCGEICSDVGTYIFNKPNNTVTRMRVTQTVSYLFCQPCVDLLVFKAKPVGLNLQTFIPYVEEIV
jgi:RNase P subunit RPR2